MLWLDFLIGLLTGFTGYFVGKWFDKYIVRQKVVDQVFMRPFRIQTAEKRLGDVMETNEMLDSLG